MATAATIVAITTATIIVTVTIVVIILSIINKLIRNYGLTHKQQSYDNNSNSGNDNGSSGSNSDGSDDNGGTIVMTAMATTAAQVAQQHNGWGSSSSMVLTSGAWRRRAHELATIQAIGGEWLQWQGSYDGSPSEYLRSGPLIGITLLTALNYHKSFSMTLIVFNDYYTNLGQ
ncbi:uncharacterized protein J3R85_003986 [Psidium guajava]|nr:uncharacterized protein J3R85_003986 [Psidium guajava]